MTGPVNRSDLGPDVGPLDGPGCLPGLKVSIPTFLKSSIPLRLPAFGFDPLLIERPALPGPFVQQLRARARVQEDGSPLVPR